MYQNYGLAELSVLYEISSLDFSGSEESLFQELVEKASRLFGVRRVVLILNAGASIQSSQMWGFARHSADAGNEYVLRNRFCPEAYVNNLISNVELGTLYLEKRGGFFSHEIRLLDILSRRLIEVLDSYRLQEEVRCANERFRIGVEMNPLVAFFVFDREGILVNWNPEAERILGINGQIGQSVPRWLLPYIEPRGEFENTITDIHRSGCSSSPREWMVHTPSDDRRWVLMTLVPVRDRNGVAEVFGMAVDISERKRVENELRYRLELEEFIAHISTEFINLAPEDINAGINKALGEIGRFAGVDRSYVFLLSEDNHRFYNAYEWCAEGVEPQNQDLQDLSVDSFPWFWETMRRLDVVHVPRVADLPPEAEVEKRTFQTLGIRGLICVPLVRKKTLIGFLGFNSVQGGITWSDESIAFVRIVGEVIVNALSRKWAETEIRRAKALLEGVLDAIPDAVAIQDSDHRVIRLNRAGYRLFNADPDQIEGKKCYELIGRVDRCQPCATEAALKTKKLERLEKFVPELGLYMDCRSNPILDDNGEVLVVVEQFYDVTERREMEERLRQLSIRDGLTGLYNRAYFEEEMHRLEGNRFVPVGVIVCDVDGLKLINDTLGHDAGDALLLAVADSLRESFRQSDAIARIGGDEFSVLLPKTERVAVERAIQRIRDAIVRHHAEAWNGSLSLSIGGAVGDGTPREIYRQADNNMYREKLHRSQSARSAIVSTLMKMLEARDFITEGHADRLQQLAYELGRAVGLSERQLGDLCLLAQFHDIGKVGIPDRILFKPGLLAPEERVEMQRHSEIGHRIALSAPDLVPIADWILKHHEWWNGNGYPLGLKEREIPLECRILAIADAYDAMTSDRPYRKAMSIEAAIAELTKYVGVQFDPGLVQVFVQVIGNRLPENQKK
ncbi:MAG: diguanylate cyclase [Eubacteriales bacterium]|nr:diguanylate cyclase [Eubacteriales bacterium]